MHRDQRALEGMIADSFSDTESDGEVSERGKFLADIKDPQFKPSLVSIQDLKVNLYHNTGVVTGVYHTKGSYNGKPYDHLGRHLGLRRRQVGVRSQPHQPAEEVAARLRSQVKSP